MLRRGAENILLTRVRPEHYAAVRDLDEDVEYHEAARIVVVRRRPVAMPETHICVVTAGTSDLPVAEEAAITAEVLGNRVDRVYDAGVAGLHRLLASAETLMRANALVVVAGMEGALPSVVGGSWTGRSSRCRPPSATARTSAGSPRCSRCSTPAPAASPSSTSTTALARATSPPRSITPVSSREMYKNQDSEENKYENSLF